MRLRSARGFRASARFQETSGRRTGPSHEPSFSSASTHYLLSATLTGQTDLAKWVRKLLDADLAVAAAWPSETAVRVPYRHRNQARALRRIRAMAVALERAQTSDSWRDAFRFVEASPRFGLKYLRAKWLRSEVSPRFYAFSETPTTRHFLTLLALHPFFTAFRVIPHLRISWTRGARKGAPPAPLLDSLDEDASDETEDEDNETDVLAMAAEAESLYLDRQIVSAAIRVSDAHLFGGRDRDKDGFVRLMLRNSYHHFVLPGSDVEHYVVMEPRLLLHKSGVIQIDLVLSARDAPVDVRQALAMTWGPEPLIVRSQMSEPLLKGTRWQSIADYSAGEVDAAKPLATIEHATSVSMSELIEAHLHAVLSVIRRGYDHWMIYPVTILDVDDCCSPEQWRQTHRDDLIRLSVRGSVKTKVAEHVIAPRDLSSNTHHSLYANLGSAIYFQWTGTAPAGIPELDTVLLLEYALLQYMRLYALEEDVARMRLGDRQLRGRYRTAVQLFAELRQRDLRAGEAREIVQYVLNDLGAPAIRRTIETGLSLSASAYATISAERASRRTWWVTLAATAIALLVAVPPLQDLLESIPPPTPEDPWALGALQWLTERGFWGSWITMGAVLLVVAVLWLVSVLWRWRLRRWPSFRRGYKWPTEFEVTSDFSPASVGPRTTNLRADLSGSFRHDGHSDDDSNPDLGRDGGEDPR